MTEINKAKPKFNMDKLESAIEEADFDARDAKERYDELLDFKWYIQTGDFESAKHYWQYEYFLED